MFVSNKFYFSFQSFSSHDLVCKLCPNAQKYNNYAGIKMVNL